MADTLVFDMSSMAEGTPAVFVRKDWLSILDNQNKNYQGNQSVIDTSQLANSNKYMNYREAYLTIPLLLTLTGTNDFSAAATSGDWAVGMKNWYGSVIHSFTLDYNGTTIIQQTPYCGMWNTFKLMTSLSYQDVISQGSQIGFAPDTATSFGVSATQGIVNNDITGGFTSVSTNNVGTPFNEGLLKRMSWTNFNDSAIPMSTTGTAVAGNPAGTQAYSALQTTAQMDQLWNSRIITATAGGVFQVGILAVVYLKHIHSFFERVPLLKGVFMKMTINLNQPSVGFTIAAGPVITLTAGTAVNPLGGVCPLMITNQASRLTAGNYVASLSVGQSCNGSNASVAGVVNSTIGAGSILLNVPAYTFNPVFEASYLSSPIKKIVYEDIYQYQVRGVSSTFNNLITNGIANIKSVLVLPFFPASSATAPVLGSQVCPIAFQSPFDPAGCGPTSPMVQFTNFNIQVSGQNAIYNSERYSYEQFMNQLYGQNAVNGGMTDGLTSSLVGYKDFLSEYCYYYVNVGRMLPVEEAVPKSVNVLGTCQFQTPVDLYVFISYGVEVSVDILTGARV